eukprot:263878-Pyramimonas_sp.AAC.1
MWSLSTCLTPAAAAMGAVPVIASAPTYPRPRVTNACYESHACPVYTRSIQRCDVALQELLNDTDSYIYNICTTRINWKSFLLISIRMSLRVPGSAGGLGIGRGRRLPGHPLAP